MPVQKVTNDLILDPAARIRMLTDHGSSVQIDRAIPVKRYLRSGSEMERQARVYYGEKQFDKAFILYNKFATLFIEKLPKHPEYSTAAPTEKARIKKLLKDVFPRAMELKKMLKEQYEKEREELEEKLAEEEAQRKVEEARSRAERQRRQAEEEKRRVEEKQRQMEEERRRQEELEAEQLAAFLAGEGGVVVKDGMETRTELQQNLDPSILLVRNIAYKSVEVKPTPQEQQGTTTAQTDLAGVTVPEVVLVSEPQTTTQADLTATDPNLAHVLPPPPTYQESTANQPNPVTVAPPPAPAVTPPAASHLQSPTQHVPATSLRTYHSIFQAPSAPPPPQALYHQPSSPYGGSYFQQQPPVAYGAPPPQQQPPYAQQYSGSWGTVQAPSPVYHTPSPDYYQQQPQAPMETEEEGEEEGPQVPTVNRSNKPTYNALSTSLGGMNEGYRQVYVPTDTASRFLQVASTNTRKNTETCGILAGKLSQNVLRITHVIVPKQKGSSDSCETLQEEELFDVQDKYDLITLGWIHTHPSQTAFMSSVDLHTHCSYQIMLDEAIAIVCAPKHSQVGVYMLTEPHGLDLITHCEEPGFHTHRKEPPIYEECKHVHFDSGSFITIVDLR